MLIGNARFCLMNRDLVQSASVKGRERREVMRESTIFTSLAGLVKVNMVAWIHKELQCYTGKVITGTVALFYWN